MLIELKINKDGSITTIYNDKTVEELTSLPGVSITNTQRASTVEWESHQDKKGWVVRAKHNPQLAIRKDLNNNHQKVATEGELIIFKTRETAIKAELKFFWNLLPG